MEDAWKWLWRVLGRGAQGSDPAWAFPAVVECEQGGFGVLGVCLAWVLCAPAVLDSTLLVQVLEFVWRDSL